MVEHIALPALDVDLDDIGRGDAGRIDDGHLVALHLRSRHERVAGIGGKARFAIAGEAAHERRGLLAAGKERSIDRVDVPTLARVALEELERARMGLVAGHDAARPARRCPQREGADIGPDVENVETDAVKAGLILAFKHILDGPVHGFWNVQTHRNARNVVIHGIQPSLRIGLAPPQL